MSLLSGNSMSLVVNKYKGLITDLKIKYPILDEYEIYKIAIMQFFGYKEYEFS